MSETSPNESAHSASVPSEIEVLFRYQQRVTEIAVACGNALIGVSAQAEIVNIPGIRAQGCQPQVFRWSVEKLWKAIVPAEGDCIQSDPYARKERVRWPGFRPARGEKRRWIYGTSYHFAVIQMASELYNRLAIIGLEYASIDYRSYFDDNGGVDFWSVPEFRNFATTPLLAAALTILRGWIVAGKPKHGLKPWGSFEQWSTWFGKRSCSPG